MNSSLRIDELANESSIKELDKEAAKLTPEPAMKGYEAQTRMKMLLTAMQDIHYLAIGIQELQELAVDSAKRIVELERTNRILENFILDYIGKKNAKA